MALPPHLSFLRLPSASRAVELAPSHHTLEVYLDSLCPFSAKFTRSLAANVVPLIEKGGPLAGKLTVLLRLQPQPWHGTSTYTHEASLAYGRLDPEGFWAWFQRLMDHQEEFFDRPAADLSSTEIRKKLAALAAPSLPSSVADGALLDLLTFKTSPNGGVDVTDDLKWNVKLGRQNGIHVTPTVLFDGLIDNSISSSWGKDEWSAFFVDKIKL